MEFKQKYTGIGLMSGTSLDGLDIAYCEFSFDKDVHDYQILKADTITFPSDLAHKLDNTNRIAGLDLVLLDNELGSWIGTQCLSFIEKNQLVPDFIASHGHTIYHQPENGMTHQIGNGSLIHTITKIPVVYDFRVLDVALGGQGAPLVPIGDRLLFRKYFICMNLGGFANISFEKGSLRRAYDIGACNIVLNKLASKLGYPFDEKGRIAKSGSLIQDLLNRLDNLNYYLLPWPKSLGKEWTEKEVFPVLTEFGDHKIEDILNTYTHHLASLISRDINKLKKSISPDSPCNVLITGGGVYNEFLIEMTKKMLAPGIEFTIPDPTLVEFKEALIFAFMGLLRIKEIPNCLASVTGATRDSSCGVIIGSTRHLQ